MGKGFKRKRKVRRLKTTYLIVCEGSCEEIYFKGMKQSENLKNINVKVINPTVSTPYEIFRHAKREFRDKEYDAAFCVIDGDVLKNDANVEKKFSTGGVEAIFSRPCFELWFLLHYKYTDREFHNCSELISKELTRYIPGYEKSKDFHLKKSFYNMLRSTLDRAIDNARKLESENKKNKRRNGTSTDIYKLVKKILAN